MEEKPIYEQVSEILKENGFSDESEKLSKLMQNLSKEAEIAKLAANEIQGLCHVKAWGDLNIRTISYSHWGKLLAKLKRYAKNQVIT